MGNLSFSEAARPERAERLDERFYRSRSVSASPIAGPMELLTALLAFSILVALGVFLTREIRQQSKPPTRAEFEELQKQVRRLRRLVNAR